MNTQEVANRLVHLCRSGNFEEAINELYHDDIVSKEPPGSKQEVIQGKAAVLDKTQEWMDSVEEIHSSTISDPVAGDDFFSCVMDIDATYKNHGRMPMSEVCVYEVKDGRIVSDQFFYKMS
ncbi:nuclear transport factor 2 family protein [Pedobacter steynii]|uniref:SnoaL-like domain-containing protein n=1 Tax=Pedobacter steynii TaxID=430522 RepID=A0A1D7QJC8_9SPHI|nr:nuclear transport factor 2 family protein [Pedobacter steynii]AOM78776.1 hypothetical protein BFS30_17300 [Pedobacter steynii]